MSQMKLLERKFDDEWVKAHRTGQRPYRYEVNWTAVVMWAALLTLIGSAFL